MLRKSTARTRILRERTRSLVKSGGGGMEASRSWGGGQGTGRRLAAERSLERPPQRSPAFLPPPEPPLWLWNFLTGEKKARGLCPPRHTCYSPRSRLTCSDHERCPQLKRQSFRGGRFIYPPRGRTRCASLCAWIYASRHSQNPTNPPQTEAPSLEIPLNALPELLLGGP